MLLEVKCHESDRGRDLRRLLLRPINQSLKVMASWNFLLFNLNIKEEEESTGCEGYLRRQFTLCENCKKKSDIFKVLRYEKRNVFLVLLSYIQTAAIK